MSWTPAERVLGTVAELRQLIAGQRLAIEQANRKHKGERIRLELLRDLAVQDLGQALLPLLDGDSIARAAQKAGLPGLPAEDVPARREARRAWVRDRIAEIERDRRHVHRHALRDAATGSLPRAMTLAVRQRQPHLEVLTACRSHPRFERLWDIQFGAVGQKKSWWRVTYWQDKSAAKEILARFEGKTDFSEVLQAYDDASAMVSAIDAELAGLQVEVAAGEALEQEHTTLTDELEHLDERWLIDTRHRIIDHLLDTEPGPISQQLSRWSAMRGHFLRVSALTTKLRYLDALHRKHLADLATELQTLSTRIDGVEQRTRRRWAPMASEKYVKLAKDRGPPYQKRWQRHERIYGQVLSFQKYDRGRRFEQLHWWDLFTRGRYDGSFIDEVRDFHQQHPDYVFDAELLRAQDSGADEAEAAARAIEADAGLAPVDEGDGGPAPADES